MLIRFPFDWESTLEQALPSIQSFVALSHTPHGPYASINVKPHPTQYGDGWGITKGFDAKFRPEGGAFGSMYFHRQYTKSNPLSSSPQYVGITGGFDLPFQPQGREIDYWLGQIPTLPVLGGRA